MKKTKKTHIFDDVFRTMEEYIPELMLPLINEVFHTNYSDDVIVTRLADKRHIFQNLIETDSCLSIGGKLYHFECESNPNSGIIAIRMFQYDIAVALENKQHENGTFVVQFPSSCVIYLRHNKNTRNQEKIIVRMPDDRKIEYLVPIVKSQEYTKEDIFEKRLYVLLPYYILRYEKQLNLIEREENRRQKLMEEYDSICLQLCNTLGRENPLGYSELHKLIARVLDYVLQKSNETKKEVQQVMGGHILESWKDEMIRIGREEGHAEGHAAALTELMTKKLKNGKTLEQIAAELELPLEEVNELYQKIKETR